MSRPTRDETEMPLITPKPGATGQTAVGEAMVNCATSIVPAGSADRKMACTIFFGVFAYSFLILWAIRAHMDFLDKTMWVRQIEYFVVGDPRMFDFFAAYGHPGTTIVALGSFFHVGLDASYDNSLALSMGLLVSVTTAACASLCFLLRPQLHWWVAAAFILCFGRLGFYSTPPTAVVIPFLTLIVLAAWFLYDAQERRLPRMFVLWGGAIGFSSATRIDASLLVSGPLVLLLWHRHGRRVLLPTAAGILVSFVAGDPFLWFMPVQHLKDLLHKFTFHYASSFTGSIMLCDLAHAIPFAVLSIALLLVLTCWRRRPFAVPPAIIFTFLGITVLALVLVSRSSFKAIRYLYPLIVVWEVFLPLFLLDICSCRDGSQATHRVPPSTRVSLAIVTATALAQLLFYWVP
jgi:hypothetical protein